MVDSAAELPTQLHGPGGVGASRYLSGDGSWIDFRDSAEIRMLGDFRMGTGPTKPPRSAAEANGGALPTITAVAPCADGDHDGMPDAYEVAHGLNPDEPADRNTVAADGFTWLERYLSGT